MKTACHLAGLLWDFDTGGFSSFISSNFFTAFNYSSDAMHLQEQTPAFQSVSPSLSHLLANEFIPWRDVFWATDKAQNRETKKCLVHHLSFLLMFCVEGGQDVHFQWAHPTPDLSRVCSWWFPEPPACRGAALAGQMLTRLGKVNYQFYKIVHIKGLRIVLIW